MVLDVCFVAAFTDAEPDVDATVLLSVERGVAPPELAADCDFFSRLALPSPRACREPPSAFEPVTPSSFLERSPLPASATGSVIGGVSSSKYAISAGES